MFNQEPVFTTHDYVIGGKMVVGKVVLDDQYSQLMEHDDEARQRVKSQLIHQMAEFILENNLVEFTQMDDPLMLTKRIAVRAYLAPNDQVKILRVANKIV